MVMLVGIVVFCLVSNTATAPISNESVAWVDEPDGRGTWSILSSCIITLLLCVYTAVHTNVHNASASDINRRLDLAWWVFVGIFAPEAVVWTAWCQWSHARYLSKKLQELNERPQSSDATEDTEMVSLDDARNTKHQSTQALLASWTFQHSFFLVMGGFQFRPDDVYQDQNRRKLPKTIITASVMLELLRDGHADKFPILEEKDLADRSKADRLAKTLSCLQGLWLMFQLLGRVVSRLPITELEVNTFAHAVCALTMYIFWMYKPLNVSQPVYVESKGLESWILIRTGLKPSTIDELSRCLLDDDDTISDSDELVTHVHSDLIPETGCGLCELNSRAHPRRPLTVLMLDEDVETAITEVADILQGHPSTRYFIDYVMHERHARSKVNSIHPDRSSQRRIVIKQYQLSVLLQLWTLPDKDELFKRYHQRVRPQRHASMISQHPNGGYMETFGMVVVSCCYGGIHATLWNRDFPTTIERNLWRISCVLVVANAPFVVALTLGALLANQEPSSQTKDRPLSFFNFPRKMMKKFKAVVLSDAFVTIFFVTMALVVEPCVIFGRLYLFIEAFISLRSQPPEVYQTPEWLQWLPHL